MNRLEQIKEYLNRENMVFHELKTIEPYFSDVKKGLKTFELRKDDRYFQIYDYLLLVLYKDGQLSENDYVLVRITYKLPGGIYGLDSEYCILSFHKCDY